MHDFVSFNFQIVSPDNPTIKALSSGVLYGKGVFTTAAIVRGKVLLWAQHWQKLERDAKKLELDIGQISQDTVSEAVVELLETNRCTEGRARISFFDAGPSAIWPIESNSSTAVLATTADVRPVPTRVLLTPSPFRTNSSSPLAGVKSCNYLEQILSLDEAKGRGFHEAVRVNERSHVTSGCMSNVFWLKNDRLHTPTLATGCLAGTTREYVLENIECEEVEAEIGELGSADAIFLTSAGLGVVRVAEFDGRELADPKHPIQTLWPPS